MTMSRIEVFEQILAGEPANTAVLFGLAKEYEKVGDDPKLPPQSRERADKLHHAKQT